MVKSFQDHVQSLDELSLGNTVQQTRGFGADIGSSNLDLIPVMSQILPWMRKLDSGMFSKMTSAMTTFARQHQDELPAEVVGPLMGGGVRQMATRAASRMEMPTPTPKPQPMTGGDMGNMPQPGQ